MNFSAWDSVQTKPRHRSSFIPSGVIVEFNRTKEPKIITHIPGNLSFTDVKDLNTERSEIIAREINNLTSRGFKYGTISNVYTETTITPAKEDEGYNIYSHGVPSGPGNLDQENCTKLGLVCEEGEGDNTHCAKGKCVIGRVEKITNSRWDYTSTNLCDCGVLYSFPDKPKVQLKTVLRGRFNGAEIIQPASIASTLYLPVQLDILSDKEKFIQGIVVRASINPTSGFISQELVSYDHTRVIEVLSDTFSALERVWVDEVDQIISDLQTSSNNNFSFLSTFYDRVVVLLGCIIQVVPSSIKKADFEYDKETISRPVYSRLPGLAEAYRSDPAFSNEETPTQWLVSGVDEFLSKKKDQIASFYQDYLDPDTCAPYVLDWLAQHLGLTGELWDIGWERDVKITMIKNAFGWWDREIATLLPNNGNVEEVLTPKGEVLQLRPFTEPVWTSSEEEDNSLDVNYSEIRSIVTGLDDVIVGDGSYVRKVFNEESGLVEWVEINEVKFFKGLWNGLIEAKGSMLIIVFLCSLFGLKSHTALELEVIEQSNGVKSFRPKSGLRSAELTAPILMPIKYDVVQVGSVSDAKVNNYSNQLIAGVTRVSSIEESKNLFFRMPYYYNRDGRSWDKVKYIVKAWLPTNINAHIQYPYLSADLWVVGDAFFEPKVEEV